MAKDRVEHIVDAFHSLSPEDKARALKAITPADTAKPATAETPQEFDRRIAAKAEESMRESPRRPGHFIPLPPGRID